jgi:hypothetical protein
MHINPKKQKQHLQSKNCENHRKEVSSEASSVIFSAISLPR